MPVGTLHTLGGTRRARLLPAESRSNLRRWKDLQPDFVKIDKLLTQGIANSPQSVALVRAIVGFGNALGTELIAEGVEDAKDLHVLRDLGIAHGQSYLFGRPRRRCSRRCPSPWLPPSATPASPVMPHASQPSRPNVLRSLSVVQAPALSPQTPIDEVSAIFQKHPELHALAVVDKRTPVSLINRQSFVNDYARMSPARSMSRRPGLAYGSSTPAHRGARGERRACSAS